MDSDNCEEYYHRRLDELTDWMEHGLALAEVRDGLFVNLLRTKIDQGMSRYDQMKNAMCKAMLTVQCELRTNNKYVEEIVRLVKDDIKQIVDSLRDEGGDDNVEDITLALAAENVQLAKVVSMCKKRLDTNLEKVRSIKSLVDQKRGENEQIKYKAAMAVSDAKQNRLKITT